jgi:predicted amidohydrolase/lysophospholipase L1-like esterase
LDRKEERQPSLARAWLVFPVVIFLGLLCARSAWLSSRRPMPRAGDGATVRVAAIQFHSVMGAPAVNRERLVPLIELAAGGGAKIVVLPEAAVTGYADLTSDTFWSSSNIDELGYMRVAGVAETVPGPSTDFFAPLATRLGIHLTVPLVEKADGRFYNTVALLSPAGEVAAVHRKHNLWPVADASWAAEGPRRATVAETPFGRVGLMICYDVHALLPLMGEAGVDIVLHSVAFFGPNSGEWFETTLAAKVADQGVSLVLANWTFPEDPRWSGWGASCVISPEGKVLARAERTVGDQIVFADVPRGKPCDEPRDKPPVPAAPEAEAERRQQPAPGPRDRARPAPVVREGVDKARSRWAKAMSAFARADLARPTPKGVTLFTGSSSIRMWGAKLERDMAPTPCVNRGFGGSQISDVLLFFDEIVAPHDPAAIVLYCGENDINAGKSPRRVLDDFREFVRRCAEAKPGVPVVFISMKPSPSRWRLWPKFVEGNALIERLCRERAGLTYVDVGWGMLGPDGKPLPDIWLKDKLHMNDRGYVIWTRLIGDALRRVLPER